MKIGDVGYIFVDPNRQSMEVRVLGSITIGPKYVAHLRLLRDWQGNKKYYKSGFEWERDWKETEKIWSMNPLVLPKPVPQYSYNVSPMQQWKKALGGIEYKPTVMPKLAVCECGKETHGFASHSLWCDLHPDMIGRKR